MHSNQYPGSNEPGWNEPEPAGEGESHPGSLDPDARPAHPRGDDRMPPQPGDWLEPLSEREPPAGPPHSDDDDIVVLGDDGAGWGARAESLSSLPKRQYIRRGRQLVRPKDMPPAVTPQQRLLILDAWQRSGLPAGDFAPLVNVSKHTLYAWKNRFEAEGPAGLMERRKGVKGSRLPELTKRAIRMMKEANPDWGVQKISDMLLRGPALPASPSTVAKVLQEMGYELVDRTTQPHRDKIRRFERATPNQMWQVDLFTFPLKRQNQRVYLVAFMDDNSRFVVSYGLHASQSTAMVMETLRAGITSYGAPREILTDNGTQFITWRGTSAFRKECDKRGIKQIVSKPQHPQTLGKIERFWGTLWRDFLKSAVFIDMGDARARIGHFIDYYNFRRPHSACEGLVPADRFFGAAPEVLRTLKERVAAHALDIARNGIPRKPFYMTGSVDGKLFSVHAEGERVFMTNQQGREEIALTDPRVQNQTPPADTMPTPVSPTGIVDSPWTGVEEELPPGVSGLDALPNGETQPTEPDDSADRDENEVSHE